MRTVGWRRSVDDEWYDGGEFESRSNRRTYGRGCTDWPAPP